MLLDQFGRTVTPPATFSDARFAPGPESAPIGRRSFLAAAAALPLIFAGQSATAQEFHASDFWDRPRYIWMKRPATGEEIRTTYWANGQLVQDAYTKISWFMRDVQMERRLAQYTEAGRPPPAGWFSGIGMSPVLLDILYATNGWLDHFGLSRALVLTSGHRHRVTNSATEGAARNSLHVLGRAGDIIIPGVSATSVSRYGVWLSAGGVGFYPSKGFTHVDDGRLRTWRG